MTANDLLSQLRARGLRVWAEGRRLCLAPVDLLDGELVEPIARLKPALIDCLRTEPAEANRPAAAEALLLNLLDLGATFEILPLKGDREDLIWFSPPNAIGAEIPWQILQLKLDIMALLKQRPRLGRTRGRRRDTDHILILDNGTFSQDENSCLGPLP